jgi:hypothetical protein
MVRFLHRSALGGILPDQVRLRTTKQDGATFMCRAVAREWPGLDRLFGPDARTAMLNFIDLRKFREALSRARAGTEPELLGVIRTIAVEVWLRLLDGRHEWEPPHRQYDSSSARAPAADIVAPPLCPTSSHSA